MKAAIDGLFLDYAILGDDLVIGHPKVASHYEEIMKDLGVDISPVKTTLSNNGSLEFASRFFWKRVDASPISFGMVRSCNVALAIFLLPLVRRLEEVRRVSPYEMKFCAGRVQAIAPYLGSVSIDTLYQVLPRNGASERSSQ